MKDRKLKRFDTSSDEEYHLRKAPVSKFDRIPLTSALSHHLLKKKKIKKTRNFDEGIIPYFNDPSKQIKPEFRKINENTKPHFEEIVDVALNMRNCNNDLIRMMSNMIIIALKNIGSDRIKKECLEWVSKTYTPEKSSEVAKLISSPLPKIEENRAVPTSTNKIQQKSYGKSKYEKNVISEEDKFKVRMGDRLYKCREIVARDDIVIGILMEKKETIKPNVDVSKEKITSKKK